MLKKLIRKIDPVILICFIVLSLISNIGFLMYSINDSKNRDYKGYILEKQKSAQAVHDLVGSSLKSDEYLDATEYLGEALSRGDIDACQLKENGRVIFKCDINGTHERPYPKEETIGIFTSDDYEWRTSLIGPYYLATVYNKSETFYTERYFVNVRREAAINAFFCTGLAAALFMILVGLILRFTKWIVRIVKR